MPSYTTWSSFRGVVRGMEACSTLAEDGTRAAVTDAEVSAWSVGDHLEHLLLADRGILSWIHESLDQPNPASRVGDLTELGERILVAGSIPRGRGPAPEFALPTGSEPDEIARGFSELRKLAATLEPRLSDIDRNHRTLPHHVLGRFTPADWLRFLHVHHDHHAAIIADILS